MIGNLFNAISIALFSGVLVVGGVRSDEIRATTLPSLSQFYSEFYDDVVLGINVYNAEDDLSTGEMGTTLSWYNTTNNALYGYSAIDNSLTLLNSSYRFDNLQHVRYIDGYQYLLLIQYSDDDDLYHIYGYFYDDIYNMADGSYRCDQINTILIGDTNHSSILYNGYTFNNFLEERVEQSFEFWNGVRVPHVTGLPTSLSLTSYYFNLFELTLESTDVYMDTFRMSVHLELIIDDSDNTSYAQGFTQGYNDGKSDGLGIGWTQGYQQGLATASSSSFNSLFNSIADTPLRFIYGLFNFDLFGMSVLVIVLSLMTGIILFGVVKKFWK